MSSSGMSQESDFRFISLHLTIHNDKKYKLFNSYSNLTSLWSKSFRNTIKKQMKFYHAKLFTLNFKALR